MKLSSSFPNFCPDEWRLVWIFFAITMMARGIILFNLGYQTDDYMVYDGSNHSIPVKWFIEQGRFFGALVYVTMSKFDLVDCYSSDGFLVVAASLILVWSGVVLCKLWNLESDPISSAVVIGFLSLNPYLTELFAYRATYPTIIFAFGLGFLGLWFMRQRNWIWLVGCICVVAALGTYQVILNYILVVVFVGLALEVFQSAKANEEWRQFKIHKAPMESALYGLMLAVIIYFIIVKYLQWVTGVNSPSRAHFLQINEIIIRFRDIKNFLQWMIFTNEIIPFGERIAMALLVAIAMGGLLYKTIPKHEKKINFSLIIAVLILMAIAAVASLVLPLILAEFNADPRVVSAIFIWWAGVACIALQTQGFARTVSIWISIVIIFVFASIDHRMLSEQLRLNRWDFAKANRIISRLEKFPDFSKIKRLIVIGGDTDYPDFLRLRHGEIGASAFGRYWSKRPILCEATGYSFSAPTHNDIKLADELYKISPKWPADGSVVIRGDLGLVFLPPQSVSVYGNEIPDEFK